MKNFNTSRVKGKNISIFKVLVLFFLFFVMVSFLSADSIIDRFDKIFSIQKLKFKGKEFLSTRVVKLPENDPYAKIVNNNTIYLDYLLVNFAKKDYYEKLKGISDPEKLKKEFIKSLKNDKKFVNLLKEFEYYYVNKNAPAEKKKIISLDRVIEIATKFFTISNIVKDRYIMHLCVGINLIRETEKERLPQVEAFVINTIFKDRRSNNRILDNISEVLKRVKKLNLGLDKKERLLRTQGAFLVLMLENPKLKKLIISEYKKNEKYLPFAIKGIN